MHPQKSKRHNMPRGLPSPGKFYVGLPIFVLLSIALVVSSCAVSPEVVQPATAAPTSFIARITASTGEVTVERPLAGRPPGLLQPSPPARPQPMDKLNGGARVNVGAGSMATILCVDNHIHVLGQGMYIITAEWCGGGRSLPADSCQQTTGNVCRQAGSAVILRPEKDRERDFGNIPVILSPRHTHLFDPQPIIQWVSVDQATQYEVRLGSSAVKKRKEEITCVEEERAAPNQLCSLPWPADWVLEAGNLYTLVVAARRNVAEPWRESEPSMVRTLDADTAAHLQADIAAVQALALDATTQNLLLAGLYTYQQVYSQAIALYEVLAQETAAPALFNTVGDLYRQVELQRYALKAYKASLDLLDAGPDDAAMRAAAEFGSGQAEYSRLRFTQAEPYFTRAAALYRAMPVQEEYAAAEYALGYSSAVGEKYDEAEQHYRKALELYGTLGLAERVAEVEKALAKMR